MQLQLICNAIPRAQPFRAGRSVLQRVIVRFYHRSFPFLDNKTTPNFQPLCIDVFVNYGPRGNRDTFRNSRRAFRNASHPRCSDLIDRCSFSPLPHFFCSMGDWSLLAGSLWTFWISYAMKLGLFEIWTARLSVRGLVKGKNIRVSHC